ncbi:MAG: Hsp20 family protein [Alphaproteobacteria bacterium]
MTNRSLFSSPMLLGFQELEELLCKVARPGETFPPYNVEIIGDNTLMISLAVAGYTESDLEVALEDNELIVRGRQETSQNRHFTYKGIAARSFIKTFILADGMKVKTVALAYGLLNITVEKPVKKTKRTVLKIEHTAHHPCVIETKAGDK